MNRRQILTGGIAVLITGRIAKADGGSTIIFRPPLIEPELPDPCDFYPQQHPHRPDWCRNNEGGDGRPAKPQKTRKPKPDPKPEPKPKPDPKPCIKKCGGDDPKGPPKDKPKTKPHPEKPVKDNASEHDKKGGNDGNGGKDRDGSKHSDKGRDK